MYVIYFIYFSLDGCWWHGILFSQSFELLQSSQYLADIVILTGLSLACWFQKVIVGCVYMGLWIVGYCKGWARVQLNSGSVPNNVLSTSIIFIIFIPLTPGIKNIDLKFWSQKDSSLKSKKIYFSLLPEMIVIYRDCIGLSCSVLRLEMSAFFTVRVKSESPDLVAPSLRTYFLLTECCCAFTQGPEACTSKGRI